MADSESSRTIEVIGLLSRAESNLSKACEIIEMNDPSRLAAEIKNLEGTVNLIRRGIECTVKGWPR